MLCPSTAARSIATALVALALSSGAACSANGSTANDVASSSTVTGVSVTTAVTDATTEVTTDGASDFTEQDFAQAITTNLSGGDGGLVFTSDQVDCVGKGFASTIGMDRFRAAGVTPEDVATDANMYRTLEVDAAAADDLAGVVDDCGVDFKTMLLDGLRESGMSDEEIDCFEAALTPEVVRGILAASILDLDLEEEFSQLNACEQ